MMHMGSKLYAMLLTGLVLGLAWAVRGHFGIVWGASWAGGTGALAVLVATKREDWSRRAPLLTALGAIGWGLGGIMSYGIVVGYCKTEDFGNSVYGYAMLAVIGGLYGFVGGGLFGLGLETSENKRPQWHSLITEMVAFGFLSYAILIDVIELRMTPPRSEEWAVCLGSAIALAWYLHRNGFHRSLRVAGYSALGAGFGFAFGNFIQTMGIVSQVSYNWWNVMEFTLGFFGGLGMAFAVVTRDWPESPAPSKLANWLSLLLVVFVIPWTNYFQRFRVDYFVELAGKLGVDGPEQFARSQMVLGWAVLLTCTIAAVIVWYCVQGRNKGLAERIIPLALFGYSAYYVLFGYLLKGFFHVPFSWGSSESLYVPILLAALVLWLTNRRNELALSDSATVPESGRRWSILMATLAAGICLMALLTVNCSEDLPGAHKRFLSEN